MSQEANGFLVRGSPEFGLGQVQRIIELNKRVKFTGQGFKIGLGLLDGNRSTRVRGGRGEGGGRSGEGKEDGRGFHFRVLNCYKIEI